MNRKNTGKLLVGAVREGCLEEGARVKSEILNRYKRSEKPWGTARVGGSGRGCGLRQRGKNEEPVLRQQPSWSTSCP